MYPYRRDGKLVDEKQCTCGGLFPQYKICFYRLCSFFLSTPADHHAYYFPSVLSIRLLSSSYFRRIMMMMWWMMVPLLLMMMGRQIDGMVVRWRWRRRRRMLWVVGRRGW
jgi:hypothetical protein